MTTIEDNYKFLKFDGSNTQDFHQFKQKLLAVGAIKGGWDEALEQSLSIATTLTVSKHEANSRKRKLAWSNLFLVLEGTPLCIVKDITTGDPHVAWTAL